MGGLATGKAMGNGGGDAGIGETEGVAVNLVRVSIGMSLDTAYPLSELLVAFDSRQPDWVGLV